MNSRDTLSDAEGASAPQARAKPGDAPQYSTREAALRLGVCPRTVQRWVDSGHVLAVRTPGGHRRITEIELGRLLARRKPSADVTVLVVARSVLSARWFERALRGKLSDGGWVLAVSVCAGAWQGLQRAARELPRVIIVDLGGAPFGGADFLQAVYSSPGFSQRTSAIAIMDPAPDASAGVPFPSGTRVLRQPLSRTQLRLELARAVQRADRSAPLPAEPAAV